MKKAIITGTRRIGYEIARSLLKKGWLVGVVYKSSEEVYKKLSQEFDGKVFGIRADLGQWEEAERVVKQLVEKLEGLDGLVHLASPYEPTALQNLREEDIRLHFNPIAQAFIVMCKEAFPIMLRNSGDIKGRIVAFGDWATNTTPYRNYSAYFLAKGALHTAVKVLAKELAPYVLVNAIALGPTVKPPDLTQEKWEEYIEKTPLRREVSMKDVIGLTEYLLDVESMTGNIIFLDSGRHVAGECT